ncbi:MAG TPA: EcsC family protein [Candidatus Acidoferrales bacterium]|nr:EcsC family protein [Candidatus Acidoferrales bacterium]
MERKSFPAWSSEALRSSIRASANQAYRRVRVDPSAYLRHAQRALHLPIQKWDDVFYLGTHNLRPHADSVIRASSKAAALEGMGLGLGGLITVVPDLGFLSTITLRLLQKLSLLYGFEYTTEEEAVELWMAAASAAGLEFGRDILEKQGIARIVPFLMDRVAVRVGEEIAEKWTARLIPLVSAGAAGALNYYFVRGWGRRAQKHFEQRHAIVRAQRFLNGLPAPDQPLAM